MLKNYLRVKFKNSIDLRTFTHHFRIQIKFTQRFYCFFFNFLSNSCIFYRAEFTKRQLIQINK